MYIGIELNWDHEEGMVQLSMTGYVRAELHAFQQEKQKRPQESLYPWTQPVYKKNNKMLSEKASSQRRLQKIVGKFLYYARAIEPTMLMALNSLAAVQTKPTIETAKIITQILNYSATHPDAVIECIKSGMILHIYSDASYLS